MNLELSYLRRKDLLAAIASSEAGPTADDLAVAPFVNFWRLETWEEDELRLYGICENHPDIDDRHITSSPLLAFDHKKGWARSYTRWYRIGPDTETEKSDDWDERMAEISDAFQGIRRRLKQVVSTAA